VQESGGVGGNPEAGLEKLVVRLINFRNAPKNESILRPRGTVGQEIVLGYSLAKR
jgi:hypothetical protein